jgi:hypothetical protein
MPPGLAVLVAVTAAFQGGRALVPAYENGSHCPTVALCSAAKVRLPVRLNLRTT